ncbi:MAG: tetratricopeptide repeat protein [Candidatus Zixiibacteriota bacterium]
MGIKHILRIMLLCFFAVLASAQQEDAPEHKKPNAFSLRAYEGAMLAEIQGNIDEAIELYEKALYYDSTVVEIYHELIKLQVKQGYYQDAVDNMALLLEQKPDSVELRQQLADIYLETGSDDKGIRLYERLIVEKPNFHKNYIKLAQLYFIKEQPTAANDVLGDAYGRFKGDVEFLKSAADLNLRAEQYDMAIDLFDDVLDKEKDAIEAYYGTAIAYELKDELKNAQKYYEKAFRIRVPAEEIFLTYLALLARQDKMEQAIDKANNFIEENDVSPKIYQRLAFLYMVTSQNENALIYLKKTIELSERPNPDIFIYIAEIYAEEGNLDSANTYWRKFLDLENNNLENITQYLSFMMQYGDTVGTIAKFDSLQSLYPDSAALDFFMGSYYYEKNTLDSANVWFSRALRKEPNNPQILFIAGDIYERSGKREKAIKLFSRLNELTPDNPQVQNYLGYILAEENKNLDFAKELIENALDRDPNNGAYLDSYAWVLYRLGYYKKAFEYIESAIENSEADPLMYDHKADILMSLGEEKDARKALEKALEIVSEEEYRQELEMKMKKLSGE